MKEISLPAPAVPLASFVGRAATVVLGVGFLTVTLFFHSGFGFAAELFHSSASSATALTPHQQRDGLAALLLVATACLWRVSGTGGPTRHRGPGSYGTPDAAFVCALRATCDEERVVWAADGTDASKKAIAERGKDSSFHNPRLPDVVVFPTSTDEVQRIVALCAARRIPITPRGAGSGLEGAAIPYLGGVVVDLMRMKEMTLLAEDMMVVVEPGQSFS